MNFRKSQEMQQLAIYIHEPVTITNVTHSSGDVKHYVTAVDVRVFSFSSSIKSLSPQLKSPPFPFTSPNSIQSLMQEAIPFRTYTPATATGGISRRIDGGIAALVTENSVIVFGKKGCCLCHVVKKLLLGLGVNPAVFEVDEAEEAAAIKELKVAGGGEVNFPAVFVGGKLFGGLERVMATHISGELVPILKDAGALWL